MAGNKDLQLCSVCRGHVEVRELHPPSHANSAIYNLLSQLVDFTGFHLESDPFLVFNNPEVSINNMKLSSLKVDTKYTTSTQMVKLKGSHSISKILIRNGGQETEDGEDHQHLLQQQDCPGRGGAQEQAHHLASGKEDYTLLRISAPKRV